MDSARKSRQNGVPAMQPPFGLSDEALNFLNGEVKPRDRSARNLPGMRAKAKAIATAEAQRTCQANDVTMDETILGGVRCLVVHPLKLAVNWPILYAFGGGMVEGSPEEDLPVIAPLSALTGAR